MTNSIPNTWYLPWQKKEENLNWENMFAVLKLDKMTDMFTLGVIVVGALCSGATIHISVWVCQVLFILGINWQCLVTVFRYKNINFLKLDDTGPAQNQVMVKEKRCCILWVVLKWVTVDTSDFGCDGREKRRAALARYKTERANDKWKFWSHESAKSFFLKKKKKRKKDRADDTIFTGLCICS